MLMKLCDTNVREMISETTLGIPISLKKRNENQINKTILT